MPEPLIPDDVRALYEELIDEGGRIIPLGDATWAESRVRLLLESGLANPNGREPPALVPTGPDAALARLLLRWQHSMEQRRKKYGELQRTAIRLQLFALRARAQRSPDYSCTMVLRKNHVLALRTTLSRSAERCVMSCTTGPYGEAITLATGQPYQLGAMYVPPEPQLFAHGGRYRVVVDEQHATQRQDDLVAGHADGEEYRVVPRKLPGKFMIVDGHTALVALGPYGYPCLLIRDLTVVGVFVGYFELLWSQGTPWAPPGTQTATKDDTQRQRILDALAAGFKDEAIARQQGISVRTVRRHITALMQELGASTRFAAGVAAARRGWVTRMTRDELT